MNLKYEAQDMYQEVHSTSKIRKKYTFAVAVFLLAEGAWRCALLRLVAEASVVPAEGGLCKTFSIGWGVVAGAPAPRVRATTGPVNGEGRNLARERLYSLD
jgi:hypothetical protein